MVEIVSVSALSRVAVVDQVKPSAFPLPDLSGSVPVPGVVAVIGIPGREGPGGPPGPAGEDAEGAPTDPGDLTLLFDNQLV